MASLELLGSPEVLGIAESQAGPDLVPARRPRSQHARADACALRDDHGWAVPRAVEVPMWPGDVLVHDDMVVDGSPPAVGYAQRRTVYLEFRPAASILEDGPWDAAWLDARLRLLPPALAAHAAARPDAPRRPWRPSEHLRPAGTGVDLRVPHGGHTPGEWCSAG